MTGFASQSRARNGSGQDFPAAERRPRALIIDDESNTRELLAESLRRDDFIVQQAGDAPAALAATLATVRDERFDVILLDPGLPGIDGLELLRILKRDTALQHIPVIVLTGWQGAEYQVRCFDAGAHDFVNKPFDMDALRARVRAALRAKERHDEFILKNLRLETARAAAEEQARAKSDFAASMSHEIRTPMNGVIAMTDLLRRTGLTPDQRDIVENLRASGEWVMSLVDDVLNMARIHSGGLELGHAPFNLRETIDAALDIVAPRCAGKPVCLASEIAPDVNTSTAGDEMRLRQILINLLGNAVKFTTSGEVILTVQPAPRAAPAADTHTVHFSVRDTGIGIAPDRLHKLFHPFVQADSSIQREYGGTGLGLAISKGLVELMGGRLWAESAPGRGSTFHFSLPLSGSGDSGATMLFPAELAGARLLVLHPNPTLCGIIERAAQSWGMQTASAPALADLHTPASFHLLVAAPEALDNTLIQNHPATRSARTIALLPVGASLAPHPAAHRAITLPLKPAQLQEAAVQALTWSERPAASAPVEDATLIPASATATATGTPPPPAQRPPLKILVTDDNLINQKVAARLLQQLGHAADIAPGGAEALAAIEQNSYDLVFMDVQMPGLDGLETTRRIRRFEAQSGRPRLSIIAMTANAMSGDREKCLDSGMDEYLAKPVRPESVQAMLEKFTQLRSSDDAHETSAPDPLPSERFSIGTDNGTAPALPTFAPAAPDPSEPLVDLERLTEFSGGSTTNLIEISDLYLVQTQEQIDRLDAALQQGDTAAVIRLAHNCAGASGVCGIVALEPLFRELEHLGREGRADGAPELLETLRRKFMLVRGVLLNSRETSPLS